MPKRSIAHIGALLAASLLSACIRNNGPAALSAKPPSTTPNTVPITVDTGPSAATGQINHAYVTVKVCAAGQTQCATIDHVWLDTASSGLRLMRSVLVAGGVTLTAETDAQGQAIAECMRFGFGQTWGPVALADVSLAGELAAKLPVQLIDDSNAGAPPPATCGANGTPIKNTVPGIGANGILGVGVFAEDCGAACVNPATPLPLYYGCTSAGVCTAENIGLTAQVTNPVARFATDNNGVVVNLPNLVNANGDASVTGQLIFGIATQTDNALPAVGLTVLGADANGDFKAAYNGGTTAVPALIDSGTESYSFDDPAIAVCSTGAYVGYYCPAVAPHSVFAINTGVGTNNASNTVNFAIADPNSFVANAAAFMGLGGGGGSKRFTWGMPFFYGRKIYFGIEQRVAGTYTGPFYAY
jgi:hypothetical protein